VPLQKKYTGPTFNQPPERPDFPGEERKTLAYWKEIKAFEQSLEQSKGKKEFIFYDGPPFATGLPHYGHILAGTIKDIVTRYAHQTGHHVERRFGWDCHGLPVEFEIDKKLGIKGRPDVMKMGIDKYNEECRGIVQRYTGEWRTVVERFGRWIDFDNDYKTMDRSYMESVWWVFKQLFEKNKVYRAFRVMPYSTACNTPLSNFEVAQNYKEVADPSIVVKLKCTTRNEYFLVWTTTPWTLPSNLAICVHPEFTYLRFTEKKSGENWVCGKDRIDWLLGQCKLTKKDIVINEEVKGADLKGLAYEPIFDYFVKTHPFKEKAWHVVTGTYVTTDSGTCIVHQAPAFGEEDMGVCAANGICTRQGEGLVCPVDDNGIFIDPVKDFKGLGVKEADTPIRKNLKDRGILLVNNSEVHNYPFCWRSDTPLIYRAQPSWFIKVEEIRENLMKNNQKSRWVPKNVQDGRFHNWLKEARDWCVSRNRYWGTPIPLWVSADFEEVVCIGSVAELEEHCGHPLPDIHRHFIDQIEIPSKQGKGMLKRVDEVFDCWFESGSMPYAQQHYPFENKERLDGGGFPAQFIAEGLDQTRGWFYTLMVLSTHLFDKPAFQNLIVNGLVLASDGKKMSKRLNNYPAPDLVAEKHGADAIRMYMANSPVVRAEPLKFKEEAVRDVVKEVFLPWFHAYRFLIQEVTRFEETSSTSFVPSKDLILKSENITDKWIYASCQSLIKFVREELDAYRLYTVVPKLVKFLEDLTNWYVRLNRERMRGKEGEAEARASLSALYDVMLDATILLSPVVPFITELIYQNLSRALPESDPRKKQSVHFVMMPEHDSKGMRPDIEIAVTRMQSVVVLARVLREKKSVSMKTPVKSLVIMNEDEKFLKDVKLLESYVKEELNVRDLTYKNDMSTVSLQASPNFREIGKRAGKEMKNLTNAVKALTTAQIREYEKNQKITICGIELAGNDIEVKMTSKGEQSGEKAQHADTETMIEMDFAVDQGILEDALGRELVNRVQRLRKVGGLQGSDHVLLFVTSKASKDKKKAAGPSATIADVLKNKKENVEKALRRPIQSGDLQGHEVFFLQEAWSREGEDVVVTLTLPAVRLNKDALKKLSADHGVALGHWLASFEVSALAGMGNKVSTTIEDKKYELVKGTHFTIPE